MTHGLSRALAAVVFVALAFGSFGCAKRVPVENGAFEAQQKVVLTLSGGRSIQGRIDTGQDVRYTSGDSVFKATVASVTADSVRLDDLVLIDTAKLDLVAERLADARVEIGPAYPPVSIARSEIEKVELLRFDVGRSFRNAGFWTYGGAVLVMLLGERS